MKWEKLKPPEPDDPMCCCECSDPCGGCWDCSDMDEACHRWLKCTPLRSEESSGVLGAAIHRLEVVSTVPALLLLPVLLRVAALHCLLGAAVLTALPALVLWYYYATHRRKRRTLFFLALALYSLGYMYYLFLAEILPRGNVTPRQVCTVTIGMALTLVSLVRTKRGPGFVVVTPAGSHETALAVTPGGSQQQVSDPTHHHHSVPAPSSSDHHHNKGPGYQQHHSGAGGTPATSSLQAQTEVQGGGGRGGGGRCPVCRALRPPRAGHCRICGSCVKRLDHHCIWINSCVGEANHRSFLLTLSLFLLTSLYGISLVLHSVCPRQYLLTALLYCPGVYDHYSTALCFTCAWYSSMVTGGLLHLLLLQLLNVSCNVTEREAVLAMRNHGGGHKRRLYGMVVDPGRYSRGFCRNWLEFLTMAGDHDDDRGSVQTSYSCSLSV